MVTSSITQSLLPPRLVLRVKFPDTILSSNVVNTNPSKLSDIKMAFLRFTFSVLSSILCCVFVITAYLHALHFHHPEYSLATMTRRTRELAVLEGVGWGVILLTSLIVLSILVADWKTGRKEVKAKHLLIIFVMTMVLCTHPVGLLFEINECLRAGWMVIAWFVTSQISCFLMPLLFVAFDLVQFTWTTGSWTAVLVSAGEFVYITAIRTHHHTDDGPLDRFTLSGNVFGTLFGLFLSLCLVLDAHLMLNDRWSVLSILFHLLGDQHWMGGVLLPYFSTDEKGKQQTAVDTLQLFKKQKVCTNERQFGRNTCRII